MWLEPPEVMGEMFNLLFWNPQRGQDVHCRCGAWKSAGRVLHWGDGHLHVSTGSSSGRAWREWVGFPQGSEELQFLVGGTLVTGTVYGT